MEKKSKILVVEDDSLVGADLVATLSSLGYSVAGPITNGEDVIDQIDTIKPDFILMDISLNGKLDGIQTAQLLEKKIEVPIVFLSALSDEVTLQRAKLNNIYGFLIKPFDGAELRSTIELTLHRFKVRELDTDLEPEYKELSEIVGNLETNTSICDLLSKLDLFRDLPLKALEDLACSCSIRKLEAANFIVSEGTSSEGGFIPISGRISITKTSDAGKELIVTLLAPGDVLGVLFNIKTFSASCSARTQIPSNIIWIPKHAWESFTNKNLQIFKNISEILVSRLKTAFILSSSLAHSRVENRIINALIALLPDFGKATLGNTSHKRIYITRKELSELTGTTPETAIRVTKNLERQQLLDLSRPGIIKILDLNKLMEASTS
ncbi:MAG: response regulator [bacterium]|nr:response regulator [bacterium]